MILALSSVAFSAETDVDAVAKNMVESSSSLPGLLAAFSYILALLLGVTGILKLKEHVSNPSQNPLRVPLIRFLVGGALIALPIVYESMAHAINGGANGTFDTKTVAGGALSGLLGKLSDFVPTNNVNALLSNMRGAIEALPSLISSIAYLLALLFGVAGLLKLRDHVENPDQTTLKEPVIRLLAGGALFALPPVYNAMASLIGGQGVFGAITSVFGAGGMIFSSYGMDACTPQSGIGGAIGGAINGGANGAVNGFLGKGVSLGGAICGLYYNAGVFPAFLTALGYLFGLVLGVWGILKIKDHVINPSQTSIWEGISRLVAGGAFFALPIITEVAKNTLTPLTAITASSITQRTSFNDAKGITCDSGLDGAVYCLMKDLLTPTHVALNFFCTVAGFILAMIAISRLIKGAQDGARAPGGLGTMMTFLTAGALLSYNALVRLVSVSLTMVSPALMRTTTNGVMEYTKGMSPDEAAHANTVIAAIIKFLIIVGLVSFIRGLFIIRGVAEGNSQSSIMAGVTHIIGGALAVNLGPLINAVQTTLGISAYGITFS